MKKTRHTQQITCMWLTLFMLFAGICYSSMTADSLVSRALVSVETATLVAQTSLEPVELTSAEELVQTDSSISILQSMPAHRNSSISLVPFACFFTLLGLIAAYLLYPFIQNENTSISHSEFISNYLHKKDGKNASREHIIIFNP